MKKLKKHLKKQGFTLVELIIVIAIIAVLAVAAFMMLTKWLSHSRDSRRLADLDTIHKSMEVWLVDLDNTSYSLPMPDDSREVSMNGTIWYQGMVGTGVVETVDSLVKKPIDPNEMDYVFSLLKSNRRIYQIATVLENDVARIENGVLAEEGTNKVEGTFEPALYKTEVDGGICGIVYLPSIVVANGVTNIAPEEGTQYFILNGEKNNLLYGGDVMKNYKDIMGVNKDLDLVRSGDCTTDLSDATILDTIVNNLDGMVLLEEGETLDKTYVTGLINKGNTTTLVDTSSFHSAPTGPVPTHSAEGISFTDTDNNGGKVGGIVTITPASDESDVTHYVLYWADGSDAKVGSAITSILTGSNPITYTINNNTSVPSGATKLLVVTKNSNGEMSTGITVELGDDATGDAPNVSDPDTYFATDTDYTALWSDNPCDGTMTTVELEPGTNTIPSTLSANTLYVLNEGNYITNGVMAVGNCIGLVGSGDVTILSNATSYPISLIGSYNIVSNIVLDENNISRGIHIPSVVGGYKYNTIYGVTVKNAKYSGIYVLTAVSTLIKDVVVYNSGQGGILLNRTTDSRVENVISHDNTGSGISVIGNNNSGNHLYNTKTYNNTMSGVYMQSSINGSAEKIISYNNAESGVEISLCSGAVLKDIVTYKNSIAGIYVRNSMNSIINNINSYNNKGHGIYLYGISDDYTIYNAVNNANLYNNGAGLYVGIRAEYGLYNNVVSYNNDYVGIGFQGSGIRTAGDNIINTYSYNNEDAISSDYELSYYGLQKIFANGSFSSTNFIAGLSTDAIAITLGLSDGDLQQGVETFDDTWVSHPNISGWDTDFRGMQCFTSDTSTSCDSNTLTSDFDGTETYTFGSSVPNQTRPIRWNGTDWEYYGSDGSEYNTSSKVGQW